MTTPIPPVGEQDGRAEAGDDQRSSSAEATHAERVASNFPVGSRAHKIALYHDHIEDNLGQPPEYVFVPVAVLSRWDGEDYWDYIERVATTGDRDTIEVKLADARDNLARCRGEFDGVADTKRAERYERVLVRLSSARGRMPAPISSSDSGSGSGSGGDSVTLIKTIRTALIQECDEYYESAAAALEVLEQRLGEAQEKESLETSSARRAEVPIGFCHVLAVHPSHLYLYMGRPHFCRGVSHRSAESSGSASALVAEADWTAVACSCASASDPMLMEVRSSGVGTLADLAKDGISQGSPLATKAIAAINELAERAASATKPEALPSPESAEGEWRPMLCAVCSKPLYDNTPLVLNEDEKWVHRVCEEQAEWNEDSGAAIQPRAEAGDGELLRELCVWIEEHLDALPDEEDENADLDDAVVASSLRHIVTGSLGCTDESDYPPIRWRLLQRIQSLASTATAEPSPSLDDFATCQMHGSYYSGFAACPTCAAYNDPDSSRPVSTDREEGEKDLGDRQEPVVAEVGDRHEGIRECANDAPTAEAIDDASLRNVRATAWCYREDVTWLLNERERLLRLLASTSSADALPQPPPPEHEQVEAGKQDSEDETP